MDWTSKEIRNTFLTFFKSKGHEVVNSAPMVVKNDPTLMFTNAGMNQFKDDFLGNTTPKSNRITDTQKCLRVSGKHNDLEEVGVDTYHHTMFEMLGNWSFGDYFKQEAIDWAWELLTEVYKLDKDRLYVTVFGGDEGYGVDEDTEAAKMWEAHIAADRILRCDKKDNFWEMGDVGPCGPCSEIHVDIRSDEERKAVDGKSLVNEDHPQVIEIWNLVFMEYNKQSNGELLPLPAKHVDTGMGFERLCMVLQNVKSNYDTTVFGDLIEKVATNAGKIYGKNEETDIAIRVIVDHVRAVAFSIADGQLPSNTGAGYVIRRILRRAIRYGYSFLGLKQAFIYELVDVLCDELGEQFNELAAQKDLIEKVIKEEEESFLRTLAKGIQTFQAHGKPANGVYPGKFVFELYDTFGFPIDLTSLMAREAGFEIDEAGFEAELQAQKDRSRSASKAEFGDWITVTEGTESEFVGYDSEQATVNIRRHRKVKMKGKDLYQLVFDITPFYAEGGGQVGDKGCIENAAGKTYIVDTKKENNLVIHFCEELPADLNESFRAEIDTKKRAATEANHSATHLLHHVLRDVLGTHVEQKGSLVNDKNLRFDFSHFQKVSPEELTVIENRVNELIQQGVSLDEHREIAIDEAKGMGAMALFGEKYGDAVRVIKFGESVELCGGCHVANTAMIRSIKITSEGAVAAGIRRIEVISGAAVDAYYKKKETELENIKELLRVNNNPLKAVQDLMNKTDKLAAQIDAINAEKASGAKDELLGKAVEINGVKLIAERVSLDSNSIKDLVFQLKTNEAHMIVLGAEINDKANLTVALSDDLVKGKSLNAGNIIRELAKEIQGGGGGQPFYATAGGKNVAGIPGALAKAADLLADL